MDATDSESTRPPEPARRPPPPPPPPPRDPPPPTHPPSLRPEARDRAPASFSIGSAFEHSFRVLRAGFLPFFLLALALQVPATLVHLHLGARYRDALAADGISADVRGFGNARIAHAGATEAYQTATTILSILNNVTNLLVQCGIAYAVFQALRAGRADWGAAFSRGASRFFAVLGVMILLGLLFGMAIGLPVLLGVLSGSLGLIAVLALVGFAGMLAIQCTFYVAVPVAVVEGGVGRALSRSASLTKGARWQIFVFLLVVGLAAAALAVPATLLFLRNPVDWPRYRTGILLTNATQALLTVVSAVFATVTYYLLRQGKEGVGLDELLDVFA
jgi:hypothetical protein